MYAIFGDLSYVIVFVDDLIVFSDNIGNHISHIREVLKRLNKYNLKLRIDKCYFMYPEVIHLGFAISNHGIRPDPRKVQEILSWPRPTTGKAIQSYLGLVNFFRRCIPGYAHISAPLDDLRQVTTITSAQWTPECQKAFRTLQHMLVNPPIMNSPHPDLPFELATDASNFAVGAALYQVDPKSNDKRYIAFASRKLQGGQKNYSATKKELLALIYGINKFHQYLYGRKFRVLTDHKALTYALTKSNPTQMLQRWMDTLCNYDFTITHLPGISNILPDRLSRLYPHQPPIEQTCSSDDKNYDNQSQVTLRQLVREINGIEIPHEHERELILKREHSKGHFGVDIMLANLWADQKIYWPGIRQQTQQLLSQCEACIRYSTAKLGYLPLRSINAELPMDHIAFDTAQPSVTTPEGYNYILVIVCVCTRFIWLRALKTKTAQETATTLYLLFMEFGFPKILQSDNGTEFVNSIINKLVELIQAEHRTITPYNPQANGLAERHVGTCQKTLFKLLNGDDPAWKDELPLVQTAINTKVTKPTKSTPFALFFARPHNLLGDYKKTESKLLTEEELEQRYRKMHELIYPTIHQSSIQFRNKISSQVNKYRKISDPIPVGTFVMTLNKSKKFKNEPTWEGPFKVVRITTAQTHVLQDRAMEILPRNYTRHELKIIQSQDPLEQSQVIRRIVEHRGTPKHREYLVEWENKALPNSWIPPTNFDDPAALTTYWHKQHRQERTSIH
jgi:transposase InsO family protein